MPLPQTPEEGLSFFRSLPPSTIRLGLAKMAQAVEALGNPQKKYLTLHVAGTNGKGSTCAFAASVLRAEGYRVGLYTSPHLISVNERIQVDGVPISDAVLGARVLELLQRYPESQELTFFEFGTLLAFWHFAQAQVEVAVLETGLGGRLDATSVCSPAVTAVTPISFDHMEYLGNTLSAIAGEKAGIFRPHVPVVLAEQSKEALMALCARAESLGAPVYLAGRDFELKPSGEGLEYRGMRRASTALRLGLRGSHQKTNAAVALASLELLSMGDRTRWTEAGVRRGVSTVQWPGRLEELASTPTVLVDGAHNPHGALALKDALLGLYPQRAVHLVFGALSDKDPLSMARLLFPLASSLHLSAVANSRTEQPQRFLELAAGLGTEVRAYPSVEAAVDGARQRACPDDLVVCAGSLYLVGQVKSHLGRQA